MPRASAQSHPDAIAQSDAAQFAQAPRVPARITQAVNESNRMTLRGNVHRLARAEFDRGAVPDAQPASHVAIVLKRSDEQETSLHQLLDQQQDKSSPNYHKWLTPDQFGKQFGPADSDIQAVTDWLTSRGFTNIKVNPGRTRVEFDGNIGQISSAFQTQVHHFFVNNKMHIANVSDPQIPAALSPVVAGVVSLHDFRPHALSHRLGTFRRNKDTHEVKPLFTFGSCGSSTPCYAVGPGDFAKIYNAPATVSGAAPGTGVTIAIVQDSNINPADVLRLPHDVRPSRQPASMSSSTVPTPASRVPTPLTDDEIEADLDVQWAGAVAPGAQIDLVVSQDSESIGMFGTDISAIYIVDNNIAPILSESFGACEASIGSGFEPFYIDLWQQASAQGITAILSAGDSGSAGCDPDRASANQDVANDGIAVSGLASTAYNVALGGTDFQNFGAYTKSPWATSTFWNATNGTNGSFTQTSAKGYIPEWPWNDSCAATATTGNLTTCTSSVINPNSDPSSANFGIDLVAAGGGPSSLPISTTNPALINTKPSYQVRHQRHARRQCPPDSRHLALLRQRHQRQLLCHLSARRKHRHRQQHQLLRFEFAIRRLPGSRRNFRSRPCLRRDHGHGQSENRPASGQRQLRPLSALQKQRRRHDLHLRRHHRLRPASSTTPSSAITPSPAQVALRKIAATRSNQFGVLIDPTATTKPAFITSTGYDNATGLGSVNITNLLNAWSTATFTADTVTLTPPTTSITHGTSVTFNVSVTPLNCHWCRLAHRETSNGHLRASAMRPSRHRLLLGKHSHRSQRRRRYHQHRAIAWRHRLSGRRQICRRRRSRPTTSAPSPSPSLKKPAPPPSTSSPSTPVATRRSTTLPPRRSHTAGPTSSKSPSRQLKVKMCLGRHCRLPHRHRHTYRQRPAAQRLLRLQHHQAQQRRPRRRSTRSARRRHAQPRRHLQRRQQLHCQQHLVAKNRHRHRRRRHHRHHHHLPRDSSHHRHPRHLIAKVTTQSSGVGPTGSVVFKVNGTQVGNAVAVISTAAATPTTDTRHAFATPSTTLHHPRAAATVTAAYTTGDSELHFQQRLRHDHRRPTPAPCPPPPRSPPAPRPSPPAPPSRSPPPSPVPPTTAAGPTGSVQFMNGTQALGSPANLHGEGWHRHNTRAPAPPRSLKLSRTCRLVSSLPLGRPRFRRPRRSRSHS